MKTDVNRKFLKIEKHQQNQELNFEKLNKIDKQLAGLRKKGKIWISKIRNERGVITNDATEINLYEKICQKTRLCRRNRQIPRDIKPTKNNESWRN